MSEASAGSAPAASLKRWRRGAEASHARCASAGSAPAASLKPVVVGVVFPGVALASAGSAPAASLKHGLLASALSVTAGIRGVCPRGLIEATLMGC